MSNTLPSLCRVFTNYNNVFMKKMWVFNGDHLSADMSSNMPAGRRACHSLQFQQSGTQKGKDLSHSLPEGEAIGRVKGQQNCTAKC